jgi:uncharacterized membrane protein YgdD (TMEM256/DUF423 family)
MLKGYLKAAAILGMLGVILGAFASHILKDRLEEKALAIFETGVRYLLYHVFALIAAAILYKDFPSKSILWSCRFFIAGIIIFSGSLFALSMVYPAFKFLGAITPIGGTSFILGWGLLFFGLCARKS